ncbi:tRNAHis guanylyltransferase [Tilletiaria anomala UBC 951]|uniref:tRNA(His) guanylyltransferase n=1 Tax=Tilletiaria anomala (strain ATCC 24038 / CBS 436.72 / UBC 951) TaxID=1037660 RepID=A0A066WSE5_TILAU|nr:tRNAHis guanylyltransferase [Tilletiaria anomala UBC 951]KDN53610.1 tRNAHis guanylyltransferase [Tilletiaria anomala UBC 951]
MAGSKYAYVRSFELPDPILPNVFMVVRIDGKGFHKFSVAHGFAKPNDAPALELMNHAARHVMQELKGEVVLAFGESDEYSFLLKRQCTLYNRRESKIVTHIVSMFTAGYVFNWSKYFPDNPMLQLPSFDGRLVVYPGIQEVRDYYAWRQVDTHINNLYNTTFWALIQEGSQTETQAHETLQGTVSGDKNEILHARFGINYDKLPPMFRKGTTILWAPKAPTRDHAIAEAKAIESTRPSDDQVRPKANWNASPSAKVKKELRTMHVDIIGDAFWKAPQGVPATAASPSSTALLSEPWSDPLRLDPNVTAFGLLD